MTRIASVIWSKNVRQRTGKREMVFNVMLTRLQYFVKTKNKLIKYIIFVLLSLKIMFFFMLFCHSVVFLFKGLPGQSILSFGSSYDFSFEDLSYSETICHSDSCNFPLCHAMAPVTIFPKTTWRMMKPYNFLEMWATQFAKILRLLYHLHLQCLPHINLVHSFNCNFRGAHQHSHLEERSLKSK